MEQRVTTIIAHIAASHGEMAKILETHRHVSTQMAGIVQELPDSHPDFAGLENLQKRALQLTRQVTAYLNSLADLEEAIAKQTEMVMKEMHVPDEE
ncbi:nucleoside-diphosphate sugar epimerase [Paenibacillus pectinilyticus]|uniref:Nucleoside-diphosphate sugar epimerase n=1 Tax=Paenibacillus pectinilyticus TaxID=512399 RepID=A0A1C1A0P6_9BACL|nr:nucleoside-diphosphate sugar epimerase [Paenibacillus pectinilyticus]OCT14003.1 nucleoside-diphosphate sugar epimerase [Paenibacillus pectinilyticus]